MNDITALMATVKAAAEKATPGRIGDRIDGSGSIKYECRGDDGSLVLRTDHKNMEYGFVGDNGTADEQFFRVCVPDNILALVEALEKAKKLATQQGNIACALFDEVTAQRLRIAELEGAEQKLCAANVTLDARAELAERRLAALTAPQPPDVGEHFQRGYDEGHSRGLACGKLYKADDQMRQHRAECVKAYRAEITGGEID
ncbi:hypothetical protein [Kluyvera sp. Awk 3]|uniref:hypothetical protein n=1 Tax=Kluyvera sp. Awk 3 TaxID=2963956 RepID=UPI0023023246|nr:hypothetical protein [Kluyvera sp. Awk 3]MDA8489659.1 hypothetical protein [Kluyvera sp. Awk 3]